MMSVFSAKSAKVQVALLRASSFPSSIGLDRITTVCMIGKAALAGNHISIVRYRESDLHCISPRDTFAALLLRLTT